MASLLRPSSYPSSCSPSASPSPSPSPSSSSPASSSSSSPLNVSFFSSSPALPPPPLQARSVARMMLVRSSGRSERSSLKKHRCTGMGGSSRRSKAPPRLLLLLHRHHHARLRNVKVSANSSKAEDPLPSGMTFENALEILGVVEGASFEEILRAKNNLLGKNSGDEELAIQVEAAYDVLLMQSLTQRRSGKVVDKSIRFADVKKVSSGSGGPKWLTEVVNKIPVSVETPASNDIATQTALYAGLALWTFASGLSSEPSANVNADVPGVILALGFGASLYFLRKQNVKLGKAAVLTVAGLVAGSVVGGGVESWLRVDLIPVFGIGSPAVVVSEFVLISLWLSSLYLR